uniref:Metalloendopeptidase n=1 Tax=Acrobeloides nanus TaxID=290746 RepID=A0A914E4C6_9BILA
MNVYIFLLLIVVVVIDVLEASSDDITKQHYEKSVLKNHKDITRIKEKLGQWKNSVVTKLTSSETNHQKRTARHLTSKRNSVGNQPITLTELNKDLLDVLYQVDMFLTEKQWDDFLSKTNGKNRRKRQASSSSFRLWAMPIPYYIDTTTVDAHTKDLIEQGVAFWQNYTCLRFTELTAPSSPCVQFIKDNGCYSYIGYNRIIQDLSIGVGCEHFGIITHEINHALGVFHEQSRYDRDSYITIDFTNIQPASINNFNEETNTTTTNHNVPYDYGSVMHYGEADFAINPSIPNIYAKEAYQQNTMGQRFKPNFNDLLLINTHYSCLENSGSGTLPLFFTIEYPISETLD